MGGGGPGPDTRLLLGPVRARMGGLDWQVACTVGEVCGDAAPRVFGFVTSVSGWQDSVARGRQLRGAWLYPAVEERCGLGWMDLLDQAAHLKPQIRKDITITKYKMVKQEQGSLVFNLQVPEVPPSGQQAAPEQSEVAPSAPQHPANPDTQPVPSAQHLVTNVINLNL